MSTQHTPGPINAELLEALRECERRLTYLVERDEHRMLDVVARDKARAAIAKAQQGGAT